ncbi:MAG: peroxiredoxin [Chloroflexi bacterium RBG_13_68_17]|nr:MAG: peroxiredoxin [Chloroflexi bacterium RBG_13_68_17]
MATPQVGTLAPDFTLPSDAGNTIRLSALRGGPVVLYFYPRDDTSGCTAEACGIRDDYGAYQRAGVTVLGVSPDSVASHIRFKEKYQLPFPLLADEDHSVHEAYGVWGMRKARMGVLRTTFLIASDGKIAHVFENVKPQGHSTEILAALKEVRPLAD